MGGGWRFFLQAVEIFGVQRVDQMKFTAAKAEKLDVAIALNVEENGIEIGERSAVRIFFPVMRVTPEEDIGARSVVRDKEGAEDGHLFFGRMSGENGDLIEEAFESRDWSGKGDDNRIRGRSLDDDLTFSRAEGIPGGRVQLRIH